MTSLVPYYGSDSEEENEVEESNTNTLQSKLPQIQQPKRIAQRFVLIIFLKKNFYFCNFILLFLISNY